MSNALKIGQPATLTDTTPYVTVAHGMDVVPDTVTLAVISHTSVAAPTFTQVFVDSRTVAWQWTNAEAGTNCVVQASCTVTRDPTYGTFTGQAIVSAALATIATGFTTVEAIYNTASGQTITKNDLTTPVNFNTKVVDTHNAMSGGVFTVPAGADGDYDVEAFVEVKSTTAVNYSAYLAIMLNGAQNIKLDRRQGTLVSVISDYALSTMLVGSTRISLVAGQTIDIRVFWLDSGSSNPTLVANAQANRIAIQRVR